MKNLRQIRLKVYKGRVSGVTLMEVLVASTIAMMLMTVMWSLFSSGMKQFFLTQQHLEALQVSQMALEYIENDIHAMIVEDKGTPTIIDDMTPRNTISFYASRGDKATEATYLAAKIVYGLKPIEGTPYSYFVRNGRVLYNMPLKKLIFEPIKIKGLDEIDRYFLRTTVIAMDSNMKSEYALVGVTALDMLCLRERYSHWQKIQRAYVRIE